MSMLMSVHPLVDQRFGVITRLEPVPVPDTLPTGFRMIASRLSDPTRFCRWPADSGGAGYAFRDDAAAVGAAIGEAVERYCGNLMPEGLVRAPGRDLPDALDLDSVALFSPAQYARPGFPFRPLDADLELEWAPGVDLRTGERVLVPAPLVWVSAVAAAPERGLPHTNPIIQAGLAAGADRDSALRAALYELAERDTMALTWHGRRPLRWIDPPAELAALGRGRRGTLRTRFLEFPNDLGVTVIGALVRDEATGYLSLGTAARSAAGPALRKALAEACQLQLFVADYDDPDGPYMQVAQDPRSPLKPWRADRRYRDSYRPDLADAVDYGCHLQLYLDPRVQEEFEAELAGAVVGTVSHAELGAGPEPSVSALADRVGIGRVVALDLTTSDVRPSGLRVVRVVAPGLYSNSAAGLPFLGGTRLARTLHGRARRDLPLPH